jgi:hypothetical protein
MSAEVRKQHDGDASTCSRRQVLKNVVSITILGASCLIARDLQALTRRDGESPPFEPNQPNGIGGFPRPQPLPQGPQPVPSPPPSMAILTRASLTEMARWVSTGPLTPDRQLLKVRLRQDWRMFLKSEFQVSEVQRRAIDGMSPEQIRKIQQSVNHALDQNAEIQINLLPTNSGVNPRMMADVTSVKPSRQRDPLGRTTYMITIEGRHDFC